MNIVADGNNSLAFNNIVANHEFGFDSPFVF
jgi:hypothetical protein